MLALAAGAHVLQNKEILIFIVVFSLALAPSVSTCGFLHFLPSTPRC